MENRYLLVDEAVLPEVFGKVVRAKQLLARSEAGSATQAARMAGISRSAFYKYKDHVFQSDGNPAGDIMTLYATLADEPGVLSSLIQLLYQSGVNILTVNQNIPVESVAHVSVSGRTASMDCSEEELVQRVKALEGVGEVRLLAAR